MKLIGDDVFVYLARQDKRFTILKSFTECFVFVFVIRNVETANTINSAYSCK